MEKHELTVLAIDDDPGDAELLRRGLDAIPGWNVEFVHCVNAEKGREELDRRDVDIVFADYLLGAETGIEVLNKLREVGYDHPVIILTGRGSEDVAAEALRAGAMDYLPKRVLSVNSLKRAICNAVEKHALRRAVEQHQRKLGQVARDLAHTNEELTQFYHTVCHELKTPLTSAREFVSIVLDGVAGLLSNLQCEYLGIAKDSCDQIATCLNDLLDTTRLETGKIALEQRAAAIEDLIRWVAASTAPVAHERGIRLEHETEPDLPDVLIDESRITQVLNNLLSNALKFVDEGGKVVVGARRDPERPGFVVMSVSDTGRGIEKDQLDCIFDRLHQVEGPDAPTHGGLGLGLSICRELVKLHGGEIWAESEPGRGSTFLFTVPVDSGESASGTDEQREVMVQ